MKPTLCLSEYLTTDVCMCVSLCPPQVSPIPVTSTECGDEGLLPKSTLEIKHTQQPFPSNFGNEEHRDCPCFLPVGSIPVIATECCTYNDSLKRVTEVANRVYQEFLESEEGLNFSGQVRSSLHTHSARTRIHTQCTHTQTNTTEHVYCMCVHRCV